MGYSANDNLVRGDLFNETGKWKYTVVLDFSFYQQGDPDLRCAVVKALEVATGKKLSGVLMTEVPAGWSLVILEPPFGFPYMHMQPPKLMVG